MTALDPALCARLVSEARRQYAIVEEQGYGVQAGTMNDLADQLEAALAEIERLRAALTSRVMP